MKLECSVCEREIDTRTTKYLECDACGDIICVKNGLQECWREHVLQVHGIDYSVLGETDSLGAASDRIILDRKL